MEARHRVHHRGPRRGNLTQAETGNRGADLGIANRLRPLRRSAEKHKGNGQGHRSRGPLAQMTALDTNVLVRIITNDDRAQANRAATFLREQERVFIAKTVLLELEWVLRSAYKIEPNAIISALRN